MFITLRKKPRLQNLYFKYLSVRRSSMSNTSTSEQVLYNPELLECILLHLPERDLLVNAQRVSQLWNAIITTSPTLQRILYFQPFPSEDSIKCTVNPILLLLFF